VWSNLTGQCANSVTLPAAIVPSVVEHVGPALNGSVLVTATLGSASTIGAPLGTVTISSGVDTCSFSPVISDFAYARGSLVSWGSCTLAVGANYTASYSGDSYFLPATTSVSSPQPVYLDVNVDSEVSAGSRASFTVSAYGPDGLPVPTGTVSVEGLGPDGNTGAGCTLALVKNPYGTNSAGTCKLVANAGEAPGAYFATVGDPLVYAYSGDSVYQAVSVQGGVNAVGVSVDAVAPRSVTMQTVQSGHSVTTVLSGSVVQTATSVAGTSVAGYPRGSVRVALVSTSNAVLATCTAVLSKAGAVVGSGACALRVPVVTRTPLTVKEMVTYFGVGNYRAGPPGICVDTRTGRPCAPTPQQVGTLTIQPK
jgi:hypothetical protein